MSIKDYIIDFINYVFMLLLISVFILYFIAGDHFKQFLGVIRAMMPLSFFGLVILIKFKISRMWLEKGRRDQTLDEIVLHLTFFDKMWSDMIIFSLPFIVCLLAFLFYGEVGYVDILQALVVFLVMYAWQKFIFGKER